MNCPVTEYACLPVKAGIDFDDNNDANVKALLAAFDIILSQPGAQRAYYSAEIEVPTNLRLFVDWDKIEDHIAFTKTESYEVMNNLIAPIVDGQSWIKHIEVKPFPPATLNLPLDGSTSVTEIFSSYFGPDINSTQKAQASARLEEFIEKALKQVPGYEGICFGWSSENDIPFEGAASNGEQNSGTALVAFTRWESIEAHKRAHGLPPFQGNLYLLKDTPGLLGLHVSYVRCHTIEVAK